MIDVRLKIIFFHIRKSYKNEVAVFIRSKTFIQRLQKDSYRAELDGAHMWIPIQRFRERMAKDPPSLQTASSLWCDNFSIWLHVLLKFVGESSPTTANSPFWRGVWVAVAQNNANPV